MKNILYITNIAGKKFALSFCGTAMDAAKELGYKFHGVANRSAATKEQISLDENQYDIRLHHIDLARSPLSTKNIKAYKQLCRIIRDEKIDYIHCNTPTGGILGRLAGKKCKVKKVIYQAHGFHFYKGAPKLNWIIYYPIEKWLARKTDALITINTEDFAFAQKKLHLRNKGPIYYVPGVGINSAEIAGVKCDRQLLRESLGLCQNDVVLISAGRLDANKNNETTIRAVAKVANVKFVVCGDGEQRQYLEALAEELGVADRVIFLGNRNDILELYKMADIFVLASFREGLSRSIMEGMASGMPCVVSKIRGNSDLIEDTVGGYLCDPHSVDAFAECFDKLASDTALREAQGRANSERIKKFDIEVVKNNIAEIYQEVFEK